MRRQLDALKECVRLGGASQPQPRHLHPGEQEQREPSTPSTPPPPLPQLSPTVVDGSAAAAEPASTAVATAAALAKQLQQGFRHAMRAVTVFEVTALLESDELVHESHIFSDQHGYAWRIWVKPHDKNGCVGLYLVPAEDLPEAYTADFELAIVGPSGLVCRRELRGGRAHLHKRSAGHGWPTFVTRDELAQSGGEGDLGALLHANGTLVVTASKISNVRPKAEIASLLEKRSLSKSI